MFRLREIIDSELEDMDKTQCPKCGKLFPNKTTYQKKLFKYEIDIFCVLKICPII